MHSRYASLLMERPPQMADSLKAAMAKGFTAFKIGWGACDNIGVSPSLFMIVGVVCLGFEFDGWKWTC